MIERDYSDLRLDVSKTYKFSVRSVNTEYAHASLSKSLLLLLARRTAYSTG